MTRKFQVTIEIEMPDDQKESDASIWAASLLTVAYEQRDQQGKLVKSIATHPYKPRVVGSTEIAQPAPRRR